MKKINLLFENIRENRITILFFVFIFTYLIIIMRNAFKIEFFLDDYFFLKVGKASDLADFLNFFSPYKDYFYRPIPTEIFYYFINLTNRNLLFAHSVMFITYFIGLIFLYKSSFFISKNKIFSYFLVFFYSINFTHVFQLYQVATYIEICLFTFLSIAFYAYLKKRILLSILFFVFALMSKESAALFPILIIFYQVFFIKKIDKSFILKIIIFMIISAIVVLIFKHATSQVMMIDTYKIILDPKLIINNSVWYLLWSLGVPNFIPNYVQSIFFQPTMDFWKLFNSNDIKLFIYSFIIFYAVFIPSFFITFIETNKKIKYLILILGLIFIFYLFISPTVPTIHRWMVRLTVPVVFTSAIYAFVTYILYSKEKFYRFISFVLIFLYFIMSTFGIMIHESSGLFLLNTRTINNFKSFIQANQEDLAKFDTIYFVDSQPGDTFGGSEELKNMLGSEYFTDTFFPGENKKIIYGHEQNMIPEGSFVIYSGDIY